ncbi:MAG: FAD-dependent oxidoreductase [Gemmatimonadota bacterium]|nr:FAD-dependent oxidoreductase [Gemmatimonadota bacterium]
MRIAVVGAGVSGLVAARGLHVEHEVTVFEAEDRLGGHVHTWEVPLGGRTWAVDSGFIVYNERNYPEFTRRLAECGVASQPTTMSFSVRHDRDNLEYNGTSLATLFAQRANLFRPAFLQMLAAILRFNREAAAAVRAGGAGQTLGHLLEAGRYPGSLAEWYLVPICAALWSLPARRALELPATFVVDFLDNHGMLEVNNRPEWRVVQGGSARYVEAMVTSFRQQVRLGHRVGAVRRFEDRVEVDGERFDRVVLACHSDQALAMLADPRPAERELLTALPYQANDAVLHTDSSILPRRRRAWGAWNHRVGRDPSAPAVVTYNMNLLQSLNAPETFCVTLNGESHIDPARVIGRVRYHHPVATLAGQAARARRSVVSGKDRTHYAGAYWGNGFHEAGVASGLAVVAEVAAVTSGMPG